MIFLKTTTTLLCLFSVFVTSAICQINFNKEFHANDPVNYDLSLSSEEILDTHTFFLKNAIINKDIVLQFYGHLYLSADYKTYSNYVAATKELLLAEQLAEKTDNDSWRSQVLYYHGNIQSAMGNIDKAIEYYHKSLHKSELSLDSSQIGLSLQQIGAHYSDKKEFEKAHEYYKHAIPLLQKFSSIDMLARGIGNYAYVVNEERKYREALNLYLDSYKLTVEAEDYLGAALNLNNIANVLLNLEKPDSALQIFYEVLPIMKENNWNQYLAYNYLGLSEAYEMKSEWEKALLYSKKFHNLQDSIQGVKVQIEIANLETQNEKNLRELENKKYELTLEKNKRKKNRNYIIFIIGVLILLLAVGYLIQQKKKIASELKQNIERLSNLTKMLAAKNSLIKNREERISDLKGKLDQEVMNSASGIIISEDVESIYDLNILTAEDWHIFKNYFEKVYPGFILKVRTFNSNLTEGEMRLFLLIKLKLTSVEIASILGISADSVKKNRSRLRKRLSLDKEVPLDQYIQNFNNRILA